VVKYKPAHRWVIARKIIQYLALSGFIALFVGAQRGGWPADLVNIPIRLDPLTVMANYFASRTLLTGSFLALIVVLLTLIFGRAWCGWLCPLGTILDLFSPRRKDKNTQPGRFSWRGVKYALLFVTLTAALLGNLTLLFLDPLTIMVRTLTVSVWPSIDRIVMEGENALVKVHMFSDPVISFDNAIRPELLPSSPVFYQHVVLFALLFVGLVALNWVEKRFWCRYLCPLGGLLGLLSKLAIFKREVSVDCKGCALCAPVCPTGTIDPNRNFASDPAECTMCLDCLEACPSGRTTFAPGLRLADRREYDPGRRQVLLAIGASIAGVALLRSDKAAQQDHPYRIQPPGGRENDLLTKCVRCGECLRACPTGGLQPVIIRAMHVGRFAR
jgi:polyferredoxin